MNKPNLGELFNEDLIWDVVAIPMNVKVPTDLIGSPVRPELVPVIEDQHPLRGIYRLDNGMFLSAVKASYYIIQNSRLWSILKNALVNTGLEASRVLYREFREGRQVVFQIELQSWGGLGKSQSEIRRFMTVITSFDKTTAVGVGITSEQVVCNNIFAKVFSEIDFKIYHTAGAEIQLAKLEGALSKGMQLEASTFEKFQQFEKCEINDEDIQNFTTELFGWNAADLIRDRDILTLRQIQNRNKKLARLQESIDLELERQGRTVYGLYSVLTHWLTHNVKVDMSKHDAVEYITSGPGKVVSDRVMSWLETFIF